MLWPNAVKLCPPNQSHYSSVHQSRFQIAGKADVTQGNAKSHLSRISLQTCNIARGKNCQQKLSRIRPCMVFIIQLNNFSQTTREKKNVVYTVQKKVTTALTFQQEVINILFGLSFVSSYKVIYKASSYTSTLLYSCQQIKILLENPKSYMEGLLVQKLFANSQISSFKLHTENGYTKFHCGAFFFFYCR